MFVAMVLRTVVAEEKTRIAVDRAQAGIGDKVLVLQEGSSSRLIFNVDKEPVHCIIVGIVDDVNIEG